LGLLDLFKKNSELEFMLDAELFESKSEYVHLKRLAIQTCINMIARTVSQSEFRVREDKKTIKDEMYYRLNVRPNSNTSASVFWHSVIHKLIYENECLIIQSDTGDLLIADSFTRVEYAIFNNQFKDVTVKDYPFRRTFDGDDVIYFEYANENLTKLIDSLFKDYGELFGRMMEFEKRQGQIRATVDVEQNTLKDDKSLAKLQRFIDRIYESIRTRSISIVPQQKGFVYKEHAAGSSSASVEEINKLTNGFLDQVARALGIPPSFARGDIADAEKQTKNFMTFCVDPILKKIIDELTAKTIEKKDYLNGKRMDVRRISYMTAFELAAAVDKLRSSSVMNGHELRDELGLEYSDDPIHDIYVMTKNFESSEEAIKGGEN